MISYVVRCGLGHVFQAWFRDSASFEAQAERGDVACAECGDTRIAKAPMAPRIGRASDAPGDRDRRKQSVAPPATDLARAAGGRRTAAGDDMPAVGEREGAPAVGDRQDSPAVGDRLNAVERRRMLIETRRRIEAECRYVGRGFAEQARRIHYGEAPSRGIYGEASRDEIDGLVDEGVPFGVTPWIAREN